MECGKCGYVQRKMDSKGDVFLCSVCFSFAPSSGPELQEYLSERLDWRILDTFRKSSSDKSESLRKGMEEKASRGAVVSRPPFGYSVKDGFLVQNEDASRVHSLFKTFLSRKYSLNSLGKNFGLSTNGVKKVLSNRTYLGEVKFGGKIHKGYHKPIISQEVFYATQRKLLEYKKPRKEVVVARKENSSNSSSKPLRPKPLPSF